MKIVSINYVNRNINNFAQNACKNFASSSIGGNSSSKLSGYNVYPGMDIVSFSAKNYSKEDIINPTNHCAYCGCKVYDNSQIESLANEILISKYDRNEGKIKSILEKLQGAKNGSEIAIAKQSENKQEINFYKRLMDISSKKPYLRGMDVFDEVYDMEKDEAQAALIKNMQPLLKTVDHISAQNLEQNNNYSDINLVEACYCCNHDLKKGMPFSEFYTIYPSIINNMPKEKFKYAASNILDVSQGEIIKRLSASNVLKNLQNLITLRTEAKNNLDSVDYRIKLSLSTVDKAIESCKNDIETKENKYKELSKENETLNSDEEYNALIERNTLKGKADSLNDAISELKSSIQKIDNRIYTLKNKKNLSKEEEIEIKSKTANLTEKKELYSSQIAESEIKLQKTNENIAIIDEEYPSTEILISKKNHAEDIINAYSKLNEAKLNIEIQKNKREEELQRKADVEKELKLSEGFVFKKENYTEEENSQLDYYKLLVEAYKLTQKTKTTGAIKNLVNEAAQKQLTAEIKQIENTPIIQSYNYKQKYDELQKEKQRLNDNIPNLNRKVNTANQELKNLNRIINNTSLEEAKEMVTEYDKRIKLRKEKEKALEIKKKMTVLKTEIVLLESTIEDLRKQKENILALFNNC